MYVFQTKRFINHFFQVIYTDSPGFTLLKSESLQMPNTELGRERDINIDFLFEEEIRVIAEDTTSDNKENFPLTFDYDVRKPHDLPKNVK